MTDDTRALVVLSATLGVEDDDRIEAAMRQAATAADAVAAEEILLQSYLFLGYPRTLDVLARWRSVTGREPPVRAENGDLQDWRARGERVCAQVYGAQYDRLLENVRRLHPELEDWMLTEGYGKVLARPGVSLAVRELCVAALLVGTGALPQLRSHLRGALNVGAARADVEEAVELACTVVPAERAASAREVWETVSRRWLAQGERTQDVC